MKVDDSPLTPDQFHVHVDWPVQWGDQDMFGHVNNVVYFRWLETARVEYMRRLDLSHLHGQRRPRPDSGHMRLAIFAAN